VGNWYRGEAGRCGFHVDRNICIEGARIYGRLDIDPYLSPQEMYESSWFEGWTVKEFVEGLMTVRQGVSALWKRVVCGIWDTTCPLTFCCHILAILYVLINFSIP